MSTVEIDIAQQSDLWPACDELIRISVLAALSGAGFSKSSELSVVLADDAFIQDLNKTYRSKDKPTNVLSFPQDEDFSLGDIILAYETIKREADEQHKSFEAHLTHLCIHGTLHLLGFDHISDKEAEEMEALEIRILAGLNIENPYESGGLSVEDMP